MTKRPFQDRALPEFGPGFPAAIQALVPECQAELEVIDSLAVLPLHAMSGRPLDEIKRLKLQYRNEERNSEEFLNRRLDLSLYLYDLFKIKKAWYKAIRQVPLKTLSGEARATRLQEAAWWTEVEAENWPKLGRIDYDVDELDPDEVPVVLPRGNGDRPPDSISDALAQGIGIDVYL